MQLRDFTCQERGNFGLEQGTLPDDIPANPGQTYKNKGWVSLGDWLGTGTVAAWYRKYREFNQARAFVRGLGLTGSEDWRDYCRGRLPKRGKFPEDIPANPHNTYKNKGWISWGDWLGTGTVATYFRKYREFNEARGFVRSLGLKNNKEWKDYRRGRLPERGKLPEDIPANPHQTYKNKGWISWGDWLGTGTVAAWYRKYREFNEARAFVRGLGLKSHKKWMQFCTGELLEKGTLPDDIPVAPHQTYKNNGWVSMGDWLGTGTVATRLRNYREFKKARAFVRGLGLKGDRDWRNYCKGKLSEKKNLPDDIPVKPARIYKDKGWVNLGDWLGTGTVATRLRKYREFKKARAFVRGLGLKGNREWRDYCNGKLSDKGNLPDDIPTNPHRTYKNEGWVSMGDWLGTSST